jgi:1-deoxy-D-xylulose-5-phosphate reductoisomerase
MRPSSLSSQSTVDRPPRKKVAILGSTGSIGTQTLDVITHHRDRFDVVALAAASNRKLLSEQSQRFEPRLVVTREAHSADLALPVDVRHMYGAEGLREIAMLPDLDILVVASSGHAAIEPTIDAVRRGITIALANKEAIVCAGDLIIPLAKRSGAAIHPVDSEHSAIWQSMDRGHSEIERLILTASGGPFLDVPLDALAEVTFDDALRHPTWNMGAKVTIDSATMMNKGLEVIEAHWLFGMEYESIDVIIHRQSIVHSIVEYRDGSQIAQLSLPDMRLPIQFALTYPHHLVSPCRKLDLREVGTLTFQDVDSNRFPALELARQAGATGGTMPTILSAADEVAVEAFSLGRIRFPEIVDVVRGTMERHDPQPIDSLETVLVADAWGRDEATRLIERLESR